MERTLLLVDDEENILRSLGRLLRRDGYNILTANSGHEGMEVLKENDVSVIISDQRMPQMTGVEFLSKVKDVYPGTVRIVLSGYTDLKSVTDAINQGAIYRFLTKPWDDALLRANIEEAFQYHDLQDENIRLTRELKQANGELSTLNQELEKRVEKKTHEVILNMRAAQISQEVLENLPVAVLGIGDDGIIAVANQLAHRLLGDEGEYLVGRPSGEVLPEILNEVLQYAIADGVSEYKSITLNKETSVEVCCSQLGCADHIQGSILVMRPLDDQVNIQLKRGAGFV